MPNGTWVCDSNWRAGGNYRYGSSPGKYYWDYKQLVLKDNNKTDWKHVTSISKIEFSGPKVKNTSNGTPKRWAFTAQYYNGSSWVNLFNYETGSSAVFETPQYNYIDNATTLATILSRFKAGPVMKAQTDNEFDNKIPLRYWLYGTNNQNGYTTWIRDGSSVLTVTLTYDNTPPIKYYDGSNWKTVTVKYYDGKNWIDIKKIGYYTGSQWVYME